MIILKDCNGDDYTTGCLLDYPYFKKYYKFIAIDLRKQNKKLDADPKDPNLDRAEDSTMFFIIEEAKETVLNFSKEQVKYYDFIFPLI